MLPRAAWTSRPVAEVVWRSAAELATINVAMRGAVVMIPSRWWVLSIWERLSSLACSAALPALWAGEKPRSESDGAPAAASESETFSGDRNLVVARREISKAISTRKIGFGFDRLSRRVLQRYRRAADRRAGNAGDSSGEAGTLGKSEGGEEERD